MIDPALFTQTFPPRWKLGETWIVSAKTDDVLRARPGRPVFETNEFLFKVVEPPDGGADLARVVVSHRARRGIDECYDLTFRTKPFSLAAYRVMDLKTGAVRYTEAENGPNPFLGPRSSGLIVDFPVEPPEHALAGPLPFTFELHRHGVQTVEVTSEGLRFVVTVGTERCTFEWKRGEPWWSTFRRVLFIEEAGEFDVDSAHLVREPAGR